MLKIKTHSIYDHFPDNKPSAGDKYVNCYSNEVIGREKIEKPAFALMLEPRSISKAYEYVESHSEEFDYIFTHDSELLKLPNARFLLWGAVWGWADIPKTKGISLISSDKELCDLHKLRKALAIEFEHSSLIDVYGTLRNKSATVDTYTAHAEYRFAVAIENYIDDFWFTEKILNCFSHKTVPIYLGARKIGDYFDTKGIIQAKDGTEVRRFIKALGCDERRMRDVYNHMKPAIERNYEKVAEWDVAWRDRFLSQYGDLLKELLNGNTKA